MAIPTARGTLLPLLVAVASACSETPSPEPSPPRRTRSAPPVEPAVEAPAAPVSDLLPEADVIALKASRADDLVQRGDLAGAQRELAVVFQYLQAVGDDAPTTLLASAYYVRASLHVPEAAGEDIIAPGYRAIRLGWLYTATALWFVAVAAMVRDQGLAFFDLRVRNTYVKQGRERAHL